MGKICKNLKNQQVVALSMNVISEFLLFIPRMPFKHMLSYLIYLGPFLLEWMPSVVNTDKLGEFLKLLVHVIKYNAAYLDEEVVAGLVK